MISRDTILLVFGYGGAQDIFDRHLPYFIRGNADILAVSPCDSPLVVPSGHMSFQCELSQHYGWQLMKRHERSISAAIGMEYENICCVEADSIVLKKISKPSTEDGIDCFLFNNEPGSSFFQAKTLAHWPWLMTRATAQRLVETFRIMLATGDIERGFPDRMLSWAAEQYGIPLIHSSALCYSQNRIDTPQKMQEGRAAIANGATFIHGIKTAEKLQELKA